MPRSTAARIASQFLAGMCPSLSSSVPSTSIPISRIIEEIAYDRKVMKLEQFPGVNAGYVLELYERYRQNPESVDAETRKAFEAWSPAEPSSAEAAGTAAAAPTNIHVIVGAANLVESIRRY